MKNAILYIVATVLIGAGIVLLVRSTKTPEINTLNIQEEQGTTQTPSSQAVPADEDAVAGDVEEQVVEDEAVVEESEEETSEDVSESAGQEPVVEPTPTPAPTPTPEPESEPEPEPEPEPQPVVKVFNISGENFAFSSQQIVVNKGDTVTIVFNSTGGLHDWTVDKFGAATSRVNAGRSTQVTFVADTAGSFEYYCSVGSHRALGMVGTLIVQ